MTRNTFEETANGPRRRMFTDTPSISISDGDVDGSIGVRMELLLWGDSRLHLLAEAQHDAIELLWILAEGVVPALVENVEFCP